MVMACIASDPCDHFYPIMPDHAERLQRKRRRAYRITRSDCREKGAKGGNPQEVTPLEAWIYASAAIPSIW